MFPQAALDRAAQALQLASAQAVRIATAETCTAGLVSGCITSVPGASKTFERGFVLYHDTAKATGLGVAEAISRQHGAVSAEVTKGLAEGALAHSTAGAAVAVTGYAGPGGGSEKNPVGTVYVAAARKGHSDIAVANLLGSNIFNVLGILGATALVTPIPVALEMVRSDAWWMMGVAVVLFPVMRVGRSITRLEGAFLLAGYLLYLALLLLA